MIPILAISDIIKIKAVNNPGFVSQQGKIVYFHKMEGENYSCSLSQDFTEKRFVIIKPHQILEVIDYITGAVVYEHNPSDAL